MKVQINTDKTINWDARHLEHFTSLIEAELERFSSHITTIVTHLSDENGKKEGINDIRCLLEARIEGRQPVAVTCLADTVPNAVSGAIDKLKSSLDSIIGKMQKH